HRSIEDPSASHPRPSGGHPVPLRGRAPRRRRRALRQRQRHDDVGGHGAGPLERTGDRPRSARRRIFLMMTQTIAGLDEAGRGALAGPVVAGACILPSRLSRVRGPRTRWSPDAKGPHPHFIADSKQLTPAEREHSFAWITSNCAYGVGIADVATIEA